MSTEEEKKKEGRVTGIGCAVICALLAYFAVITMPNTSAVELEGFLAALFGVFGFICLWKPDTWGAYIAEYFKRLNSGNKEGSDSHDTQIQQKSNGSFQVMTHDSSKVDIHVSPPQKEQLQKSPIEEKEILRNEKIVVDAGNGYDYEFDLIRGEHVKAEVESTSPIDIFFADEVNDDKWNRGKAFESEDNNESVLETTIDYVASKKGKWYVIIENNGEEPATVKIQFYEEKSRSGFFEGPFGEPQ
jgi:hypothetical protein